MTAFVDVAGHACSSARLYVPQVGPWWVDLVVDDDPDLSGAVVVTLGDLTLRGTVAPSNTGIFGARTVTRVIAGGNGWSTQIPARAYRNDALVRALEVATDAALEVGETLDATSFTPESSTIGTAYVRSAGPASRALEDAIGAVPWYVDFDGTTKVGTRATSTPSATSYDVLDFDPNNRLATIAADELSTIAIGSVLAASERLPSSQTVRELRIEVDAATARIVAYTGGDTTTRGRLAAAVVALVERVVARQLFGLYRYRVLRMNGTALDLQAVRPSSGQPDLVSVAAMPGLAGASAQSAGGSEVLVAFVEGDRTQPVVVSFDRTAPTSVTLDATSSIKLGAAASDLVALSSKVDGELTKIASTLGSLTGGGGSPASFLTPYVRAGTGASKTSAE